MFHVQIISLITLVLIGTSLCLPPHRRLSDEEFDRIVQQQEQEKQKQHTPNSHDNASSLEELGIEYTRYLQQVIEALEKDEQFKKKLETANEDDIKTAKIAEELEYVNHHVRSKLDELKRTELQRLKELAKKAYHPDQQHFVLPGHIDHENPNTFEIKDFKKLIHKVALDLEEADKKRKQMFKEYEMQKHFEKEQELKTMDELQRKQYMQEEEEKKKKEMEAKKRVHHPGSKQQLEEVWVEQDHMSKNDFNPRTFFAMHDVDGNGFLDEEEVKTLFLSELDKLYAQGMPHADLMERAEEMERMREHVFQEMDKNRDRLISWEEFHAMSLRPEFNEDPGWEPINDEQEYTPEELAAFEKQRQAELEELYRQGKLRRQYPQPVHASFDNNSIDYHNIPQQQMYPGQVHAQQSIGQGYVQQVPNQGHAQQPVPVQGYAQPPPGQHFSHPEANQPYQNQNYGQPNVLQSNLPVNNIPQHNNVQQNNIPQPNNVQQNNIPKSVQAGSIPSGSHAVPQPQGFEQHSNNIPRKEMSNNI